MRYQAWIGLGSNVGSLEQNLDQALQALQQHFPIRVLCESTRIYTTPEGEGLTGVFLNSVAQIETDLPPVGLLAALLQTETELGRDRSLGPNRTIDLDILLMRDTRTQDWIQHRETPQIPHPRMAQRAFVMQPLREILAVLPPLS